MMFIGLNSQIFSQKRIKCIHRPKKNFTDAVFVEDFQPFQSGLFQLLSKNWEEISQSNHFRILSEEKRRTIGKYVGLDKKKLAHLVNETIYQIAIGKKEEFRLFVIKRKSNNKDLLEIVLFDPNHLFFFSKKKSKYPYGEGVVCLSNIFNKDLNEKKINCSGTEEGPQEKALIRKKDKRE